jgi:hypothetical protein
MASVLTKSRSDGNGMGIANVRERLDEALYPHQHEFHFGELPVRDSSQLVSELKTTFLEIRSATLPHYKAGRQN